MKNQKRILFLTAVAICAVVLGGTAHARTETTISGKSILTSIDSFDHNFVGSFGRKGR